MANSDSSSLEENIYKTILASGKKGIAQSELYDKIDATNQEITRLTIKLETEKKIKIVRTFLAGRWTTQLFEDNSVAALLKVNFRNRSDKQDESDREISKIGLWEKDSLVKGRTTLEKSLSESGFRFERTRLGDEIKSGGRRVTCDP